jgi:hypothetical protein
MTKRRVLWMRRFVFGFTPGRFLFQDSLCVQEAPIREW